MRLEQGRLIHQIAVVALEAACKNDFFRQLKGKTMTSGHTNPPVTPESAPLSQDKLSVKKDVLVVNEKMATALGNYIVANNPYSAGFPPKGTWDKIPLELTITLATEMQERDDQYLLEPSGPEMHEEPGNWNFKYSEHYIERALRIPYKFYRVSDGDPTKGVLVRDYFLIGFEGGNAYGRRN